MEKGNGLFHKLDRYAGVPIVYLLGKFKGKKSLPKNLQRIGILNIGSIGDNVLMSAVIQDLRDKFKLSEIVVLTGSTNFEIVKLIPGISETIKLPITNPVSCVRQLRSIKQFDILFDFGPWPRLNAIYSFFTKSKFKIGFSANKQYREYVYDEFVEHKNTVHEIENHRALIRKVYDLKNHMPVLKIENSDKVNLFVKDLGKLCIIHCWAGGLNSHLKQWPNENWCKLIDEISSDFDHFLLTGAPSDVNNSNELYELTSRFNSHEKILNVAGKFKVSETVSLMNVAKCIFSVNTGIAHIAAAINKPIVCLHGPTNSSRWAPYNKNNVAIVNPSKGHFGYLNFGFEYDLAQGDCMPNITIDDVIDGYKNLNFVF